MDPRIGNLLLFQFSMCAGAVALNSLVLGYVEHWIPPKRPTAPEAPNVEMQIEDKNWLRLCALVGRSLLLTLSLRFLASFLKLGRVYLFITNGPNFRTI